MLGGEIDPEHQGGNRTAHLNRDRVTLLDLTRFGGLLLLLQYLVREVMSSTVTPYREDHQDPGPPRDVQCCTLILQVKN